MDEQNKEHGSTASAHAAPLAETPREPQMINGLKVYPPSFLPTKAVLHTPKKSVVEMDLLHIEGIHILCFFMITFFLFWSMWKHPKKCH